MKKALTLQELFLLFLVLRYVECSANNFLTAASATP